jgi:hypothetical protein
MIRAQSSKRAFTRGRALALLPLSLLTVLGCAQIVGLGDYSVGSGAGAGGTVAGGGKSGGSGKAGSSNANGGESNAGEGGAAAGEAGVGATAGNTTSGGSAGTGTVGTGGEAGAGVIIPPAVGCDGVTPITLNQDVMRSCILRVSCDPYDPVRTISTCVTNNTQDAFKGEQCNIRSKTCADYQNCEHKGIAGDDLCPEAKWGTNFCVGNKAVSCTADGTFSSWVDCIGQGGTACGTYTDADGVESACQVNETCTGDADYVCSAETTPLYEYQCIGTQAYGFKCGDFAYCDDSSGTAGCYLTAGTCGADSTSCTTDNVAKVCSGGGEYDYDCGSVGLTCKVGPANADNDTNYCLAPGCKPADVNNCTEFCDGTKLNFCYGGAQVTADCTDYGFSGCEDFTSATPSYSACVN